MHNDQYSKTHGEMVINVPQWTLIDIVDHPARYGASAALAVNRGSKCGICMRKFLIS